jgi:hypothetical protein
MIAVAGAALALVWKFRSVDSIPKACGLYLGLFVLALVTAAAVLTVAWDAEDQANQWEFKDRHLLSDIKYTHQFMEWFHEEEGRYPREVSEDAFIDKRVDLIKQYCQGRGIEVAEVRLVGDEPGEDEERRELLIASDAEGKTLVVIYSDGTFGVSRRLLTRRASAGPKEMEILR